MTDTSTDAIFRTAADLCASWDDKWALLDCRMLAAKQLLALLDQRDNMLAALRALRQHAALFTGPDDAIAQVTLSVADAAIAMAEGTKP